jgi:hypothetical protein
VHISPRGSAKFPKFGVDTAGELTYVSSIDGAAVAGCCWLVLRTFWHSCLARAGWDYFVSVGCVERFGILVSGGVDTEVW